MNFSANDGVFAHKAKLYEFIRRGVLSEEVLDALLPEGDPMAYERQLWDYKLDLPSLPVGRKLTEAELTEFNGSICEIVKDATAFYNAYGGYVVAGVKNSTREVIGISCRFDCDDLNKRILAVTGQSS